MRTPLSVVFPLVAGFMAGLCPAKDADPVLLGKSLSQWIEQLKHPDPELRSRAAAVIGRMETKAAPAVEALIRASRDDNREVRMNAVEALGKVAPKSAVAMAAVSERIADADRSTRMEAARAARRMGPAAKTAVPALLDLLHSKRPMDDWFVRAYVEAALGEIGVASPEVIDALEKRLANNGNFYERMIVAHALCKLDRPAGARVLIEYMSDPTPDVPGIALGFIAQLPTKFKPDVIAAIEKAAESADPDIRAAAGYALAKFGDPDRGVRMLVEILGNRKTGMRRAVDALTELGPTAQPACEALILALRDPDDWVRHSAAIALGSIGKATPEAIAALKAATQDKDAGVRDEAAVALFHLTE